MNNGIIKPNWDTTQNIPIKAQHTQSITVKGCATMGLKLAGVA